MTSAWILAVCALGALSANAAPVLDPAVMDQALRESASSWKRNQTPLSRLTRQEALRMFSPEAPPQIEITITEKWAQKGPFLGPFKNAFAEASLDWRIHQGRNWVTPIREQGECSSCTAMAAAATLETQGMIAGGVPENASYLSAQSLFSCGGGRCHSGWHTSRAADFVEQYGIPDEACLPYTSGATGMDVSCSSTCSNRSERSLRPTRVRRPTQGVRNVDAVKAALKDGPLLSTMYVYPDFLSYGGGVYRHVIGEGLGAHAVSIIGYSDADRAWIIKNSWGEAWGEAGFARVAWDDISGVGSDTWGFELAQSQGALSFQSLRQGEILSGDVEFKVESRGVVGAVQLVVRDSLNSRVLEKTFNTSTVRLDTQALRDGVYEVSLTAKSASGVTIDSSPVSISVLNRAPRGSLRFRPLNFSPTGALGRLLFEVFLDSSPIPWSSVEFTVEKNGKRVASKTVHSTAPEMLMGWDSSLVDPGTYEVRMSATMDSQAHPLRVEAALLRIQIKK